MMTDPGSIGADTGPEEICVFSNAGANLGQSQARAGEDGEPPANVDEQWTAAVAVGFSQHVVGDDARTDGDRSAAQARVVALFDGGEEGVGVEV